MNGSSGAGGSIAIGLITLLLFLVLYVWVALALAAVFRKVGEKSGKAWVPFLNLFVVLELGGISGWAVLLVLVPIIGSLVVYVLLVVAAHRINLEFGLGGGMTVLAALVFPVWASVLGFGSARWLRAPAHAGIVGASDRISMPVAGRTGSPAHLASTPAPAAAPAPATEAWPALLHDDAHDDSFDDVDHWAGIASTATDGSRPSEGRTPSVPGPRAAAAPIASAPAAPPLPPAAPPLPPAVPVPPAQVAPPATVTRPSFTPLSETDDDEPWAPRRSRTPTADDVIDETSDGVSAVAAAPQAGAPRSALSSVSALHTRPDLVDDDVIGETVITRRRRARWALVPARGEPIDLVSDVVILGRSPLADPSYPGAQLVAIADDTRTVSKTHARLELRSGTWFITDLGSTNGVLLVTLTGTEIDAEPGVELAGGERFLLGDAEVRLQWNGA